jgi:hypothetical protein
VGPTKVPTFKSECSKQWLALLYFRGSSTTKNIDLLARSLPPSPIKVARLI